MNRKRLTEAETVRLLEPFADALWRIGAMPAFNYFEGFPEQAILSPRSRACIIHDLACHRARVEFLSWTDGVRIIEVRNGHTLVEIEEKILLRLKKLNETKDPSNVRTKFIRLYEAGAELPGIPPKAQRATLGYRLNPLQTTIRDVRIASRDGAVLDVDIELFMPNPKVISIAETERAYKDNPTRLVQLRGVAQRRLQSGTA